MPTSKKVTYNVDIKKIIKQKLIVGIADSIMDVDGRVIYHAKNLRVGLFQSTDGF